MLLVDLLGWWYSRGWAWALQRLFVGQTQSIAGFFSIGDLLKTLFAPFRQDVMNLKGAPLSVRLQALGGNLISRVFGLIIRTVLIIIGVVLIAANAVLAAALGILWPLLPLSPVVALVFMSMGVSL